MLLKMENAYNDPALLPMRYSERSDSHRSPLLHSATQNSIRVAQWLLQVPGATSYIGCIGKDKFSQEMTKNSKVADILVGKMDVGHYIS
ncbi:adenosine kinase [Trifolium repens]|nr:adenosine kinase [Trifolium repens]